MGKIKGLIVSVRSLAMNSPDSPAVHIVTDDVLKQIQALFDSLDPLWKKVDKEAKHAWDRDKALMGIADKAWALRLTRAWKIFK